MIYKQEQNNGYVHLFQAVFSPEIPWNLFVIQKAATSAALIVLLSATHIDNHAFAL